MGSIRKFFIQNFVGSIEIQFGRYERFHLPNKVFTKILSSFKIVIILNITSAKIKTKSADVLLKRIILLIELKIAQLCSQNGQTLQIYKIECCYLHSQCTVKKK